MSNRCGEARGSRRPGRRNSSSSAATSETIAKARRAQLKVNATITPVSDNTAGALEVREGRADAPRRRYILLSLAKQNGTSWWCWTTSSTFSHSRTVAHGDDDFRLAVDTTLSRLYRSGRSCRSTRVFRHGRPTTEADVPHPRGAGIAAAG
jgi:hypothetical protein